MATSPGVALPGGAPDVAPRCLVARFRSPRQDAPRSSRLRLGQPRLPHLPAPRPAAKPTALWLLQAPTPPAPCAVPSPPEDSLAASSRGASAFAPASPRAAVASLSPASALLRSSRHLRVRRCTMSEPSAGPPRRGASHAVRAHRDSVRAGSVAAGHQQQTTAGAKQNPDRVTVTMPIHPLNGVDLAVVRFERDYQHGGRYVVVERPQGGPVLRLPIEWTDRGPPWVPAQVDGRPVRLAASGLLRLARAVQDVQARTLAISRPRSPDSSSGTEGGKGDATTSAPGRTDESGRRRPQRSARRMGDARAQKASGTKQRRGGRR